ncbi:MAG: hypothetical protein F4W95_02645 [Chloroflexi bacterium]|nr:hypothetical protein [Chloroflexota bacterium]MYD47365.1 hypothetical protein [Chloroflexota bacterium]
MPPARYDDIAAANYRQFIGVRSLTNDRLRDYFNACFQDAIDAVGCYSAWACIDCIRKGSPAAELGDKPSRCPICESDRVFEIATFQSRAPAVGNAFESAVRHLLVRRFELPAEPTPGNTRTHDIEITGRIAIETKGSPRLVHNPNGTVIQLGRPGLERTDTRKKAFDNAHTFRQRNRNAPFFIVSNAVPSDLVGYRSDDITGIFNITQASRVDSLATEINAALL